MRVWTRALTTCSAVLASGVAITCCTFPAFYTADDGVDADPGDASGETIGADGDAGPSPDTRPPGDTGPKVTCSDGGVTAGSAQACSCAGADAGTTDVSDSDAGPSGFHVCTNAGTFGECIGCPGASNQSCDGVALPKFATCVPGGVASLGATNGSVCAGGCPLEVEHRVAWSRFNLDDHEVSVKRFRDWWSAGHVTPKAGDVLFSAGDGTAITWQTTWKVTEPVKSDGKNDATWLGSDVATNDGAPINFVDWPTAAAFCAAFRARLPTEAEWEAAASGREGRIFPREGAGSKNDAPSPSMLPCARAISSAGGASCGPPKGSAIEGYTLDGAYDMAGSVSEWTLDVAPLGGAGCTAGCYPTGPLANPVVWSDAITAHVIRGGSYADTKPASLRAQARDVAEAITQSAKLGFRCVEP